MIDPRIDQTKLLISKIELRIDATIQTINNLFYEMTDRDLITRLNTIKILKEHLDVLHGEVSQ